MQSTTTRLFVGYRIGLQFLESSLQIRDSSLITASEDNGNYGVSPVYYMENMTVTCVLCGHRNRVWIPKGNHSKDNDLRFDFCQNCGEALEEE